MREQRAQVANSLRMAAPRNVDFGILISFNASDSLLSHHFFLWPFEVHVVAGITEFYSCIVPFDFMHSKGDYLLPFKFIPINFILSSLPFHIVFISQLFLMSTDDQKLCSKCPEDTGLIEQTFISHIFHCRCVCLYNTFHS